MTINAIQPYVHSHTFQMNFLGFLRIHIKSRGDSSYLRKVTGVWNRYCQTPDRILLGGSEVGETLRGASYSYATHR